mgnify:CR=1 FL=1
MQQINEQQLQFFVDLVVIGNLHIGQYVETGIEPKCEGSIIGTNACLSPEFPL